MIGLLVLVGTLPWAATRVFSVALYRYVTDAGDPGPFPPRDLERPLRLRRRLPWRRR